MNNSNENIARIESLKNITGWEGNTVHERLEDALTAINLQTSNSGWYKPKAVRVQGLEGLYMCNEDGTLHYDSRIQETKNGYKIQYMTMKAYNEFEKKYLAII